MSMDPEVVFGKPGKSPEERLDQVRSMLLAEIRRLVNGDLSSGRRAWKNGVRTARMVTAERLTYILEELDGR